MNSITDTPTRISPFAAIIYNIFTYNLVQIFCITKITHLPNTSVFRSNITIHFILIATACFYGTPFAQSCSDNEQTNAPLKLFQRIEQSSFHFPLRFTYSGEKETLLRGIMTQNCAKASRVLSELAHLHAQERADRKHTGLALTARGSKRVAGYGRQGSSTEFWPNDVQEINSRNRLSFGLSWDLLQNGILEHWLKAEDLALEQKILRQHASSAIDSENIPCRQAHLLAAMNQSRRQLLVRQISFLSEAMPLLHSLRRQNKLLQEHIDKVEQRLVTAKENLRRLDAQKAVLIQFNGLGQAPGIVPIFALKIEKIFERMVLENHEQARADLQSEIIRRQANPLRQIEAQARAEVQRDPSYSQNSSTDGLYVSMNVKIPFDMPDKDVVEGKVRSLKAEAIVLGEKKRVDILQQGQILDAMAGQALEMNYRFRIQQERLRCVLISLRPETPLQASSLNSTTPGLFQLVDALLGIFDIEDEALVHGWSMISKMLNILTQAEVGYDETFFTPVDSGESGSSAKIPVRHDGDSSRGAYLWSSEANSLPLSVLKNLLKAKGISTIFLSASEKLQPERATQIRESAHDVGTKVVAMSGNNNWLNTPLEQIRLQTHQMTQNFDGLHLDIEPHTLPAYKSNPLPLLDSFSALVQVASQEARCAEKELSLSVHPKLPPLFVEKLKANVDQIYIMAYGITDPERMLRVLSPHLSYGSTKLALALRPRDFANEAALEQFITIIIRKTGIRCFAFHTLGEYINFVVR